MPTPPAVTAYPIALALVEDDARVRELLRQYLCHQPEFTCPIVVGSIEELWEELDLSLPPRVVLLDVSLPGQSGLDALPALRKRLPEADIILQTMHDDPARILRALRAGATGYIVKNATSLPQYRQAILDVMNGGAALSPAVARTALRQFQPAPSQEPALLSAREQEVMTRLLEGLTNRQIAAHLALSVETVNTYVKRLFDKLQVNSRSELMSRAARGVL